MTLFRFPAGNFSEQTLGLMQSMGYRCLFWSFAYKDWLVNEQPDPAAAKAKMLKMAHSGAIYLLHSVSKTNSEVLGDVIDELRAKGYDLAKYQ
jgi:peptidoglycan-N-acetylmuramic acid deacetylase